MAAVRRPTRWLGALAAAIIFAGAAAPVGSDQPRGLVPTTGEARVQGSLLRLGPGAILDLGPGRELRVEGPLENAEFVLVRSGAAGQVTHGVVGPAAGLYADNGEPLGHDPPTHLPRGARSTAVLTCDGMLSLYVDGGRLVGVAPERGCEGVAQNRLATTSGLLLSSVKLDGKALPIEARGWQWAPAGLAFAAAVAVLGAAGPGAGLFLLVAPMAWLLAQRGLPVPASLALVAAAAATTGLSRARLGALSSGGLAVGGLAVAAFLTWRDATTRAPPAWIAEHAGWSLVDTGLLRRKVDVLVKRAQEEMSGEPSRPWLFALGSSSSGGGTTGDFWPTRLAKAFPELALVNIAEGGATSWHMAEVLDALDARPRACVMYMGHNDVALLLPGLTIADLVAGRPSAGGWKASVPPEDLGAVLARLSARCGTTLVLPEYEKRASESLEAWVAAARAAPGVHVRDPRPVLAAGGPGFMIDEIHPSAAGQAALADYIAAELRPLLLADGHP
ncbi:MAG: SGNH/GDSL hydrolase family protein [Deltaproteobacteria bacterium]|nr:SGNH/GDSL hydrolase family protein [Deltaproteobacteria bacterium]